MATEKTMIFQIASTEAALICTGKVIATNYSPDIFDDIATRTKKTFIEVLPKVLDGEEPNEITTSTNGVDVQDFGEELL